MDRPDGATATVTATALAVLLVLAGCLGAVVPGSGPDAGTPTPGPGTAVEVVEVVDADTNTPVHYSDYCPPTVTEDRGVRDGPASDL